MLAGPFIATVVNRQHGTVRVICRLVHVTVIHLNDWHVFVRCITGIVLVCWGWRFLARTQIGHQFRQGKWWRSVFSSGNGAPSRVLSAHLPLSPTQGLSTCASVFRCVLSNPSAVPHASHADRRDHGRRSYERLIRHMSRLWKSIFVGVHAHSMFHFFLCTHEETQHIGLFRSWPLGKNGSACFGVPPWLSLCPFSSVLVHRLSLMCFFRPCYITFDLELMLDGSA